MSMKVATSLFMCSSLKRCAEFYRQFLTNFSSFQELGSKIVYATEIAHAFREVEKVEELALLLSNLPIKEYQLIGQYYLAWGTYRRGGNSREVFEKVIEQSQSYRAKAFMSLAAIDAREGNFEGELKNFIEAAKYAPDLSTRIDISKGMAVVKAKEGFHKNAVKELENLIPLLRYTNPIVCRITLNSLAVELGEVGRVEEAKRISNIVLASPIASAYPEFRETAKELSVMGRSKRASYITVPVVRPVLEEQQEEPGDEENVFARKKKRTVSSEKGELASVSLFPNRNNTPRVARPDAVSTYQIMRMTIAEKRALVLAFAHHEDTTEAEYVNMLDAVGLIKEELREIDLESRSDLDNLVTDWCGMLGADEFARLISALYDCDDLWRLREIMNTMIMFAFRESGSSIKSESKWREKVQARLKPQKKN